MSNTAKIILVKIRAKIEEMATLKSFIEIPQDSDWTIHNIPFGIFSTLENTTPRPGTAIGEHVRP